MRYKRKIAVLLSIVICIANCFVVYASEIDEICNSDEIIEESTTERANEDYQDVEDVSDKKQADNIQNNEIDKKEDSQISECEESDINTENELYTESQQNEESSQNEESKSNEENEPGEEDNSGTEVESLDVTYSAHVQGIGWQNEITNGQVAGTTGKSLRLEALKININNNTSYEGGICYSAHVQNIGWQNEVTNGQVTGTTGKAYRLEAIKIALTGELAEHYNVYYRVHVSNIGWLPWTRNGEIAGTTGLAARVEAIEIRTISKDIVDDSVPEVSTKSYLKAIENNNITYWAHVQNFGNLSGVTNGNIAGTTGKGLRLEGLTINIAQQEIGKIGGNLQYRTHVQDIGWTQWKNMGEYSGTTGKAKRVEAIEIRTTGQLAALYDVYYQAHVQEYGWLGWAKNGQTAGTTGISYRLEALRIKFVLKGASAPGNTSNYYKNTPVPKPQPVVQMDAMTSAAQAKSSKTNYLLVVDTNACKVGVYTGKQGNWTRALYWDCAPGKSSTPTVKGEYTVSGRGTSFGSKTYTCWYYTQFYGNYLFHSVLYEKGSKTKIQDGTLGKQVSHGCVRLDINNAKWIYDNIPNGTKVYIY